MIDYPGQIILGGGYQFLQEVFPLLTKEGFNVWVTYPMPFSAPESWGRCRIGVLLPSETEKKRMFALLIKRVERLRANR